MSETPTQGPPLLPRGTAELEPNGLYAGPHDAPDRYELLGEGFPGGEGMTWRARYRGKLRAPVPLAVKLLNQPSEQDLQRWKDQMILLQHLRLDHVVWLHELFVGPPPHQEEQAEDVPDVAYLAMEWVDGPTLAELLRGAPASAATVSQRMRYVAEVAHALAGLHSSARSGGNPALHRT